MSNLSCGIASNSYEVVTEFWFLRARKQESKCVIALCNLIELNPVHGFIDLLVEVIDPKFIEVAQHYISRAVRNCLDPIVECLPIVP